jgi:hypothetical protein
MGDNIEPILRPKSPKNGNNGEEVQRFSEKSPKSKLFSEREEPFIHLKGRQWRPSLQDYGDDLVRQDWLAEAAVYIEPVSARNSLLTGK